MHTGGNTIKKDLQEIRFEWVDLTKKVHDMDQCWAVVNAVTNLQVPQKWDTPEQHFSYRHVPWN